MQNAATEELSCADTLTVGGSYSLKELKRITRSMRSSSFGPTVVYYAGVTAPAIAAGMATVCGAAFERAGWSDYWVVMGAAIIAAMAGISWYTIFMRLSYRHASARAAELGVHTDINVSTKGIKWIRGTITVSLGWPAIKNIVRKRRFLQIQVEGSNDIMVPESWFGSKAAMLAFADAVSERQSEAISS